MNQEEKFLKDMKAGFIRGGFIWETNNDRLFYYWERSAEHRILISMNFLGMRNDKESVSGLRRVREYLLGYSFIADINIYFEDNTDTLRENAFMELVFYNHIIPDCIFKKEFSEKKVADVHAVAGVNGKFIGLERV